MSEGIVQYTIRYLKNYLKFKIQNQNHGKEIKSISKAEKK